MVLKKYFEMADLYGVDKWEGFYNSRREAEADYKMVYGSRPARITYNYRGKKTTFFND